MIKEKQEFYKISKNIERLNNYGAFFRSVGLVTCLAEGISSPEINQINPYILAGGIGTYYLGNILNSIAKEKRNNISIPLLSELEEKLEEKL